MTDSQIQSIPPSLTADPKALLLDVHLAEYQALTSRITYWISIQYLTYSAVAVVLALIVPAWGTTGIPPTLVVWGGLLLLQFLAWAWTYAVWEITNTAVYLQGELRPRINRLVADDSCLGWEEYLAVVKKGGFDRFEWRLALTILVPFFFLAFGWLAFRVTNLHQPRSYLGWLGVNLYLLAMLLLKMHGVAKLQSRLGEMVKQPDAKPSLGAASSNARSVE